MYNKQKRKQTNIAKKTRTNVTLNWLQQTVNLQLMEINSTRNLASNYFKPTTTCQEFHHGIKSYGSSVRSTSSIVVHNLLSTEQEC